MRDDYGSKIKFHLVEENPGAKIRVIGIGGGGGNAVNRMIESGIEGVEFIAVNTDKQALSSNRAHLKIQIGQKLTKGLGSGGDPEVGRQAAEEDTERLAEILEGADMVFLTAGLGGGTGTGATPVLANLASGMGLLVIAIVTMPFEFEGRIRARKAEEGLQELKSVVDTVIAIPNQRLIDTVNLDTTIPEAFRMADDVLRQAAQGISDLITRPGLINLDFADVKSIMKGMGMAFMGTGIASGENRAVEAAQKAISSPLLIDTSIEGARGVLINITGGKDMTLHEVSKASQLITSLADPEANIIFGTVLDEEVKETIKVTVIATGFDRKKPRSITPKTIRRPTSSTQTAVMVKGETPPFLFEPKGGNGMAAIAEPAPSEIDWNTYNTPAFIRKTKHGSMRKTPNDLR
ncbi:MAG: cell division protein FtsZ [Candidatus Saccharicenans sp.]|uniref:cell division protein FtsZ n=1 Tax=Candidatus Saccharicenans sp. TaxID=2819258 RepID=UPI00404AC36A